MDNSANLTSFLSTDFSPEDWLANSERSLPQNNFTSLPSPSPAPSLPPYIRSSLSPTFNPSNSYNLSEHHSSEHLIPSMEYSDMSSSTSHSTSFDKSQEYVENITLSSPSASASASGSFEGQKKVKESFTHAVKRPDADFAYKMEDSDAIDEVPSVLGGADGGASAEKGKGKEKMSLFSGRVADTGETASWPSIFGDSTTSKEKGNDELSIRGGPSPANCQSSAFARSKAAALASASLSSKANFNPPSLFGRLSTSDGKVRASSSGPSSSSGRSQASSTRQPNNLFRTSTYQAGSSTLKKPLTKPSPWESRFANKQSGIQITSTDDDDSDIEVITEERASLVAQRKWKEPRAVTQNILDDNGDSQVIKKESDVHDLDGSPSPPPAARPAAKFPQTPAEMFALAETIRKRGDKSLGDDQGLDGSPSPPPPTKMPEDPEAMLERAKTMLKGGNKPLRDVGVTRNVNVWNENSGPSGIGSNNPRKRALEENMNLNEERRQMNLAMQDDEDNAWMNEEPEDDGEYGTLTTLCTNLLKQKKNGKLGNGDAMELYKVQKRLQLLTRLRAASRGETHPDTGEDDESMFIPESRDAVVDRHIRGQPRQISVGSGEGMDDDAGGFGGGDEDDDNIAFSRMLEQELNGGGIDRVGSGELDKDGKPKRRRGKVAKNAREAFANGEEKRREKEREKEQKKAQKKKGKQSASTAPKKSAKGKGKATAAKGKKGKSAKKGSVVTESDSLLRAGRGKYNHWNGSDDVGQMILDDLMNNDPIAERLNNPIFNVGAEPEIQGAQVKTTQFQRLFANIPEGSNKRAARNDRVRLQAASKSFGFGKVKAQDGKWLVKGMMYPLYHHQLLGAQWMVQRELSDDAPHGGLLADSMGLGKTVQTLACMVANPPMPEDKNRKVKATLIVVPATVIDQWIDEIKRHASRQTFPKVIRYKKSSNFEVEILEDLDIVVTSYHEVMRQFPFPTKEERAIIQTMGHRKWWEGAAGRLGVLHQVNWYRVVLDEAHAIKNNNAQTSLACQNLKSVYRWCLTGTPLLNKLEELFPYLRFLKANYSMDWTTFQKYFCDPDAEDCHSRITTLLSYTMIRRTMKTSILNRPIITLPKPHPFIRYVHFSPPEKIIYRITENRFRSNLNHLFKHGDASRNYGVFMVQLLRLRQCTSHPFMLERTIKEAWTLEDVQELKARLKQLADSDSLVPFYEETKVWVEQSEVERQAAREAGETVGVPHEAGEMLPFGKGDFGMSFEIGKALSTLNEKQMMERVTCGICADFPAAPKKTDCGHIFCQDCILDAMHTQMNEGDTYTTCPNCDKVFQDLKDVQGLNSHAEDEASPGPESEDFMPEAGNGKKRQKMTRSKGIDLVGFEPKTKDSTWVSKSDYEEGFPLAPSAKTAALKAILLKGFEEAPMDKVVIYVQFRTLARIVGRICRSEDWGFVYLTGDTSLEHRTRAIKKFRDDNQTRILIAGLKCGGLGLNFPWANRCISLDLWWNHAVEQQAFGRIFRMGQEKETYMTRIVVKNSVDMRLLTMQVHKLEACEKAINNGEDKEKPNLSLRQLANLFGFLRTGEDGGIISVEADYEDQREWDEGGAGRVEADVEGDGEAAED